LISVIIPIYNGEKYIKRCFESVFSQTEKNFEIVAVDDGSTDSTFSVLKEYENEKIKVVHTENGGVSRARNVGIENATGEYITFLDVDDELLENALEGLLFLIKKYNADISVMEKACCKNESLEEMGKTDLSKLPVEVWEGLASLEIHAKDHVAGHSSCAKLYKSELIKKIRFEEGRKVNEDSFFTFLCFAKAKKVVYSTAVIYKYYQNNGSASRSDFSDKFLDILYFAKKKAEILKKEYPSLEKYSDSILVHASLSLLFNLCKTKDKKYKNVEKECIGLVKKYGKKIKYSCERTEKLSFVVRANLFPLYKKYAQFRFYRH
jgi:glycosyltransferase involved in cell wall biosynthesis